jgi:uncharacterized protein with von Willebrand factor type A (vWA) domain
VATPLEIALGFASTLRESGLSVPVTSSVLFCKSLSLLDLGDLEEVYWAARSTLLFKVADLDRFNRAFEMYFGVAPHASASAVKKESVTILIEDDEEPTDGGEALEEGEEVKTLRFSSREVLRHKDFGEMDEKEANEILDLIRKIKFSPPMRRSLRERRSPVGRRLDMRKSIVEIIRHDGETITMARKSKGLRKRKLVILCDVSGSMEPYARVLIRFAQASLCGASAEVFTIGTRLTRITKELYGSDLELAMQRAADAVKDWSGGTRLGESLGVFNSLYGVRGLARGSIVVLLSDGWDRGDPEVMAKEMERLARVAHSVIWVNPLKATPGYQPLTRGMSAALPYVDEFLDGHCLDSLEKLVEVISHAGDNRHGPKLAATR